MVDGYGVVRAIDWARAFAGNDYAAFARQRIVSTTATRRYTGKVVRLINEFAISESERTCLFFESATRVTFIGSATNGANGAVTNLVLPGNI